MMATRVERRVLTIGWIAVAAVVALAVREWLHFRAEPTPSASPPVVRTTGAVSERVAVASDAHPFRPPAVGVAVLVLRARRGACWVSAHRGSARGKTLFEGTLAADGVLTLRAPRLWVRMGAPANLDATVDGRPVALPRNVGDVVVTAGGLRAEGAG